jgi:hypothetical protein
MGLQVEKVTSEKKRHPVGAYIPPDWEEWLQGNRVELNAMTTDVFLDWLDRKLATKGNGKLIPPATVARRELEAKVEEELRRRLTDIILAAAGLDDQVAAAVAAAQAERLFTDNVGEIQNLIHGALYVSPVKSWRDPVSELAKDLARVTLTERE